MSLKDLTKQALNYQYSKKWPLVLYISTYEFQVRLRVETGWVHDDTCPLSSFNLLVVAKLLYYFMILCGFSSELIMQHRVFSPTGFCLTLPSLRLWVGSFGCNYLSFSFSDLLLMSWTVFGFPTFKWSLKVATKANPWPWSLLV